MRSIWNSFRRQSVSQGRIDDCIAVARNGIAEYPNSYMLLNKLMYALFLAGDSDGNIPEWQENMKKYDSEITMIGERIMKYCPDQDIRLEAAARLAFNHCEMGRRAIGRAIFETLPSQKYCKETQIWWRWTKKRNFRLSAPESRRGMPRCIMEFTCCLGKGFFRMKSC